MLTDEPIYMILVLVVLALLVWGFYEILSPPKPTESDSGATMSRQIKGFGLVLLSWVVLAIGAGMIFQSEGGFHTLTTG